MQIRRLLLVFFLLVYFNGTAQLPERYLRYGVKEGLSQNSVHAIFRDRDGLIWIGTQDGLNSFDGKNFTVYRHDENDNSTISDQFILHIREDQIGNLWIGTRNGLNKFNKRTGRFKRYYVTPDEPHHFQAAYQHFSIEPDGNIIIVKEALWILNTTNDQITKVTAPRGDAVSYFVLPGYQCWALNQAQELFYSADIRKSAFHKTGTLPIKKPFPGNSYVSGNLGDSLLLVYAGPLATEIAVIDAHTGKMLRKLSSPIAFSSFSINGPDNIMLSSPDGICRLGLNNAAQIFRTNTTTENGLPPGSILCTYTDQEGNFWVGTSGHGFAVSNRSFANFRLLQAPVKNDVINAIAKLSGSLLIGTRTGLYRITDYQSGAEKFNTLLSGKNIAALATDAHENIWAAVQGEGIYIFNRNGRIIRMPSGNTLESEKTVMKLQADSKGRMMICTTLGFYLAPGPGALSFADPVPSLLGNYIMSAFEDSKKNTWVCSNMGIDVMDATDKKSYSFPTSTDTGSFIKRSIISAAAEDKDGNIWIGTIRNGVYKFDGKQSWHYNVSNGLSSDVVYNLTCDNRNRLWVTTSAGLNIFNKSSNSFSTLTTADGVPNAAYLVGAVLEDDDHNLLFGTSEGLLICSADKIETRATRFSAFIADVKINGQSIVVTDNQFTIIPDEKTISFELASAPEYSAANIIYQYRLDGDWISLPKDNRSISYTGLPYKKLVLQVRAAASLSELEAAPVSQMIIYSKAPFWKRSWFLAALGLISAGFVVWLIMEWNRKKYRKQLSLLRREKELQAERIRIGRDLHDNIGAYTSALIAGLNHLSAADEKQQEHVDGLKEYGTNIMSFLRETIWMLNSEMLSFTAFADRIKNYALRISKNYPDVDLNIKENIGKDRTLAPTVMLNLFRIVQEALQNVYKHAQASEVNIFLESNAYIRFEVSDNGKGFVVAGASDHYGLENMQQRALESGFTLTIQTSQQGTTISIEENTADAALHGNG